jgi:hypothetical protein
VLCELVPGGVPEEITAAHAARILCSAQPAGIAGQARGELAAELLADMRRLDAQMRESKKKLAVVVKASGTSLTGLFGVGPVNAATVIGDAADVARFASRDRFAAYNGTAPIEVSSGNRKIYRLSLRGNRRINHAIHMAAITQIRHSHSGGRAYYDKKVAEGKTHKEALRCLKRQISNAIYACLQADARQAAEPRPRAREGNRGTTLTPARPAHTPHASSSDQPLPSPAPHYGPAPRAGHPLRPGQPQRKSARPLDSALKEVSICAPAAAHAGPSGGAQIRLFCRAAPGVAVPHQAEPGASARVFAAAALAPWPRGVVPGAGHAIRRPSVYTSLVSHQRAGSAHRRGGSMIGQRPCIAEIGADRPRAAMT